MSCNFLRSTLRTFYAWLNRPLATPLVWLSAMVGFGVLFWGYSDAARREWDFSVYYLAARAIWNSINPYDPAALMNYAQTLNDVGYAGLAYLYPPLTARILYPLMLFPYFLACFGWALLKCITLEIIIFLILILMRLPVTLLSLLFLHIAVCFFQPIANDLNAGNVAVFELALVLGSLAAWVKKKPTLSAFLLTFGSQFKGYPLLLALYPLHLRDKKFLRGLGLSLLLIAGLMLWDHQMVTAYIGFYRSPQWKTIWDEQVQSFYNCSFLTVILRTFSYSYFATPLYESPIVVALLVPLFPILIFLTVIYTVSHVQKRGNYDPLDGNLLSVLLCGLLLIPPRLAGYTLAWLIYPAVQILYSSIKNHRIISLILAIGGMVLLQLYLPPSQIPPGITQLLIDKDFFGLLLLFLAAVFWVCNT